MTPIDWKARAAVAEAKLAQLDRNLTIEWTRAREFLNRAEAAERAIAVLEDAMTDATAHLVGAASAYRKYAARHRSQGRALPDPMFSTRASDFDKAAARATAALKAMRPQP